MQIEKSTFVVTGGASGLGAACVKELHGRGAQVVIADLQAEQGEALAKELGEGATFIHTDVSEEASCQAAIDGAWDRFGGLQGVINCAGIGFPEKTVSKEGEPHSLKNFQKTLGVNLVGSFNMARLGAASMIKRGPKDAERGVVIFTASVAAFEGQVGQIAYSASKGGLVGMCLPMARDLARERVRVMVIAPGIFDTPMLQGLPENVRDALGKMVPNPSRLGDPKEFAELAAHIVENEMLNGSTIRLDGAIRMQPK